MKEVQLPLSNWEKQRRTSGKTQTSTIFHILLFYVRSAPSKPSHTGQNLRSCSADHHSINIKDQKEKESRVFLQLQSQKKKGFDGPDLFQEQTKKNTL